MQGLSHAPHDLVDGKGVDGKGNAVDLIAGAAEAEYQLFYLIGVDGVFTDFPDTAVRVRDVVQAQRQK